MEFVWIGFMFASGGVIAVAYIRAVTSLMWRVPIGVCLFFFWFMLMASGMLNISHDQLQQRSNDFAQVVLAVPLADGVQGEFERQMRDQLVAQLQTGSDEKVLLCQSPKDLFVGLKNYDLHMQFDVIQGSELMALAQVACKLSDFRASQRDPAGDNPWLIQLFLDVSRILLNGLSRIF